MSGSNEFFYLDSNGKKQDETLHNEILKNGDDEKAFNVTRIFLKSIGFSDEEINSEYKKAGAMPA